MKLIDTHAHLDEVPDLEGALKRAQDAGVCAIIGVGTDLASNEKILQLADRFPNFVLPAVGLHPWRLDGVDLEANARFIERELSRCVALGEVGLDFEVQTPREIQEEVLKRLLSLAFRAGKPVLLHARRAWGEALELLKSFPLPRAVFHWYSGPPDVLRKVFERGFFISATPAVDYSERHRAAIQAAPLSQLVLETDAPEVYRGVQSEPRDLRKALQSVSVLKAMEAEELARHTYRNAVDFFQLPQPWG